jgi:glutathione S-transferase
MADYTLNILRPSVNNLTARIFVRAAGLDFEEVDVWGKTMEPAYLQKYAAHLTPTLEDPALPRGTLGESCAIMAYLCNKHGLERFYPTDPGERAMVDNAMLYHTGTLYPLLARATYPTLGFPQYAGEVGPSEASDELKAQAQKDAEAALADPLNAYETYFLDGRKFIGGDRPSIADIRLAASLEFLRSIDYSFSPRIEEFMSAVEEALGDAYSEPAADVRGFVESVKSPA